jgi:hypothetical protein
MSDVPRQLERALRSETLWECDCGHLKRTHDTLGVCQATHCACQDGNYRCRECGEPTGLCSHTPDTPPQHTHPCPTCRQARPCTATGCADGPRECANCSNCRG